MLHLGQGRCLRLPSSFLLLIHAAYKLVLSNGKVASDAALRIHILNSPLVLQMVLTLLVAGNADASVLLLWQLHRLSLLDLLALLAVETARLGRHMLTQHVLLDLLPRLLVVALSVFALISRIKEQMVSLGVVLGRRLQTLAKDGYLRSVMQVVRKEALRRMQLLPQRQSLLERGIVRLHAEWFSNGPASARVVRLQAIYIHIWNFVELIKKY